MLIILQAVTLAEWEAASADLDILENNNTWKKDDKSLDYNVAELREHMESLENARLDGDIRRMLHIVRTTLSRDMAGMSNLKLYQYSHIGTKEKIENYIRMVIDTLNLLVEAAESGNEHGVTTREIYHNLLTARQSFGRSALLLSGGGTFGMNHVGVLRALWKVKLLPRIISGASAGSIVAAILCAKNDNEVPDVIRTFCYGDLAVFHDPDEGDSWLRKVARLLTQGSMFDIQHLIRVMKGMLGNLTFLEAYNRTRRILNICVSSASLYELPKLLNYVTSPHILIWSAVAASCSVPLVFSPASLLVKDPKTGEIGSWSGNLTPQKWIDGSVDNDLPMQRLSEMFNVNHFIVSQVNPHVVPFLVKDKDVSLDESERSSFAPGPSWYHGLSTFAKTEMIHRMTTLADSGFMTNVLTKTASVLSQTYSGDITILPEISYIDFPRVLSNPTSDFLLDAMIRGERATWPKLSRIRNHCAIELALDNALNEVRAKTVFSEAQATLRRQVFKRTNSEDGTQRHGDNYLRPRMTRKWSQNSEPGADILELARESVKSAPATATIPAAYQRFHHKSHSTQLSDLLSKASSSPTLRQTETFDLLSVPHTDGGLSPGLGLVSDDTADLSSVSSATSISSNDTTCTSHADEDAEADENPELTPVGVHSFLAPLLSTDAALISPTDSYHPPPFLCITPSSPPSTRKGNNAQVPGGLDTNQGRYNQITHERPKTSPTPTLRGERWASLVDRSKNNQKPRFHLSPSSRGKDGADGSGEERKSERKHTRR